MPALGRRANESIQKPSKIPTSVTLAKWKVKVISEGRPQVRLLPNCPEALTALQCLVTSSAFFSISVLQQHSITVHLCLKMIHPNLVTCLRHTRSWDDGGEKKTFAWATCLTYLLLNTSLKLNRTLYFTTTNKL